MRAHLGVETQHQWSELAIARRTPVLMALFSFVTLLAAHCNNSAVLPVRTAAWYAKEVATFSDTLAFVRRYLWGQESFSMSRNEPDTVKIPRAFLDRLFEAVAYAA
ncbi:hypothetical protein Mmc1_3753 [Magnetococcus marinus MC-1]|uniref:Uncharacterized protein n=2 Tax=Magnetococcus TaxID=162171 RepID=A0LE45_MAGMM|nr:hypothetical protein Mmc1_3753 [Magnetococcus marinus MC-1]